MFRIARFIVLLLAAAWLLSLAGPVLTAHADPDPSPTATATATPTAEPTVTPTAEPTATPTATPPPPPPPVADPTTPPPVDPWQYPYDGPSVGTAWYPGGAAALLCAPIRWVALEPVPGQPRLRLVVPERVVTQPGPTGPECPTGGLSSPGGNPAAKAVAKPQVVRIPIGGIPAGDGSAAMPKMLPRTGPAYPTWAIGLFALGCFALGWAMLAFGNRTPKPLPLRKDAGAISLRALGRDAAVVAACLVVSAGTFLAIAQATHQPVTHLVQAVFTPDAAQLAPWSAPAPVAQPPSSTGVLIIDPANPDAYSVTAIRAGCPAWFTHSLPGQVCLTLYGDDMLVSPSLLTGAMLPGGAVIRVHTAAGIENCTHTTGFGYSTDGLLATGDGWHCARLPGSAR